MLLSSLPSLNVAPAQTINANALVDSKSGSTGGGVQPRRPSLGLSHQHELQSAMPPLSTPSTPRAMTPPTLSKVYVPSPSPSPSCPPTPTKLPPTSGWGVSSLSARPRAPGVRCPALSQPAKSPPPPPPAPYLPPPCLYLCLRLRFRVQLHSISMPRTPASHPVNVHPCFQL